MREVPLDILRLISRDFLTDFDRLRLAQTCHRWNVIAGVDVCPVVLSDFMKSVTGLTRSPHGYLTCESEPNDGDPRRLGSLGATDPSTFIKQWLFLPSFHKNAEFRHTCISAIVESTTSWPADIVLVLRICLACRHKECAGRCKRLVAANAYQLLRRAVWYGREDVVRFLLDDCKIAADVNGGTALRLALGTLGYEHSEDRVARIVYELLERGADPLRHNLWGIRLCLQRNFLVVAVLLCVYAAKRDVAHDRLRGLVHELYTQGNLEQAYLVKTALDEAPHFFCFR